MLVSSLLVQLKHPLNAKASDMFSSCEDNEKLAERGAEGDHVEEIEEDSVQAVEDIGVLQNILY